MNLFPVLSRLRGVLLSQLKQFIEKEQNYFKKISWKSPKVLGGLFMSIMIIGGSIYYLSTTTSAVALIINGKQLGLVPNLNNGKNLVETVLKEQGQPFGLIAKTHDQITYQYVRVDPTVYLQSTLSEKDLQSQLSTYL